MIDDSKISFHESTITDFSYDEDNIYVVAEEVWVDGDLKNAKLTLTDYFETGSEKYIGEERKNKSLMQKDDGEILTLKYSGNTFVLIVEWKNFEMKERKTASYEFKCRIKEFKIFDG